MTTLLVIRSMRFALIFLSAIAYDLRGQETATRPNIIIIIADDMGYGDLGAYGNTKTRTPHVDRLAREGVKLTNFYVTASACTPSRASILTGRYPQRNGTYELFRNDRVNDGHRYSEYEYSVSPERVLGTDLREVFISEALRPAGYVNGYFGKWDLGQLKRFLPLQQGFDFFYGFANTGIDYFTHERYGVPSMYEGNTLTLKDSGTYATTLFEREAIRFLHEQGDSPFFLYLSFNAPHSASSLEPDVRGTVQAPKKYLDLYSPGEDRRQRRQRGHMAAITCMDDAIGNVLKVIDEKGWAQNTLVIFLSDNGGTAGSADNGPLRGGKAQSFEGGHRVPCILRWPGKLPAGETNHAFLSTLELFPTIMASANIPLPNGVIYDGFNMLPVLQGKSASVRTEMFWEFRGDLAARVNEWKWVQSSKGSGLFDLSRDIGEQIDLSDKHPEIASKLKAAFLSWQKEMEAAEPRGPFKNY